MAVDSGEEAIHMCLLQQEPDIYIYLSNYHQPAAGVSLIGDFEKSQNKCKWFNI